MSHLLVFLHPFCPCSMATMRELEKIIHINHSRVSLFFIFSIPTADKQLTEAISDSALWKMANRFPDPHLLTDTTMKLANRFEANTSGLILLYNAHGRLVFQGGITPERGMEGDSTGKQRLLEAMNTTQATMTKQNAVFGCSMRSGHILQ
ncbi:MAG: hypothetical protein AB7P76_10130 [Candidatus Melainabacteria bacterium]